MSRRYLGGVANKFIYDTARSSSRSRPTGKKTTNCAMFPVPSCPNRRTSLSPYSWLSLLPLSLSARSRHRSYPAPCRWCSPPLQTLLLSALVPTLAGRLKVIVGATFNIIRCAPPGILPPLPSSPSMPVRSLLTCRHRPSMRLLRRDQQAPLVIIA